MTSKVVPVFKNKIMTYFKVNQDKRIAYHHLFQDYINRTEPKYLSPFLMNSLLVLFQHDHGINPKSLKKAVDFLGQDFEFSKDGLSDFQLRSFGIRIRLYEILCGDCNSDLAIKLAKEKGLLGKSLQCLLLRIMHKEKGSVACYDWMKSLLSEPWGVTVRKEKVYALWHKESCNLLLNYLCKDKELDYARKVFEDMKKMDIPMDINSYNSLLSCDARVGNYPSALETFQQLREDVIPNRVTYNWMIHCALRSKLEKPMEEAQKYIEMMKTHGFHEDAWTVNNVMTYFLFQSNLDKVFQIYKESKDRDFKTYTIVLTAAFKRRCITTINKTLRDFKTKGVGFDVAMFTLCMDGFRKMYLYDMSLRYYKEMVDCGYEPALYHYQILLDIYCKKGEFGTASRLLDEMAAKGFKLTELDLAILMHGYSVQRKLHEAVQVFSLIPKLGIERTRLSYNLMLVTLIESKRPVEALKFIQKIWQKFGKLSLNASVQMLKAYIQLGNEAELLKAFNRHVELGYGKDPYSVNLLVSFYVARNQIAKAFKVAQFLFDTSKEDPSVNPFPQLTHTTIMHGLLGYFKNRDVRKYANMLQEIGGENAATMDVFLRSLFFAKKYTRLSREFWRYCQEATPDPHLYYTFMYLMYKAGKRHESIAAFQHMLNNGFEPTLEMQRMLRFCTEGEKVDLISAFLDMGNIPKV